MTAEVKHQGPSKAQLFVYFLSGVSNNFSKPALLKSKIFQSVMDAAKQCLINRLTFLYLISVMVSFLFC